MQGFYTMYDRLDESKNRDCDYIIAVNFVTFLILWKINKYDEAKRYIDINRKIVESILEDDTTDKQNQLALSVIFETSLEKN